MSNFQIVFARPWLLLLLLPAAACILIPYFLSSKKYRKNRNRITAMVLHSLVLLLTVLIVSGMTFTYRQGNLQNEIILLVDVSNSTTETDDEKNEFIKNVLDDCDNHCKIGIVTFGYEQKYVAPLSADTDAVYEQYLRASYPDNSATDIASALNYTKSLFGNPQTAKIVLISDGIETDGSALSVIKAITGEGIKVDTYCFGTQPTDGEVQLIDIVLPDYNILLGDTFEIGVTVRSSFVGSAEITLFDNGARGASRTVELLNGVQTFNVAHMLDVDGMHEISFSIESAGDTLLTNNTYYTYINLMSFDRILIIERNAGESNRLNGLLNGDYNVRVVNVFDTEAMPATVDELRQYDQVILVNIANADMPEGFDEILHSYVQDYGGGLFTVGGNKTVGGKEVANAYNMADMYGTLYQQMLPVQAIDYTPPLGVMLIIDRSGSMGQDASGSLIGGNKSYLSLAKDGAISCLNVMSERDWCGVMTLEDSYQEEISMTPITEMPKIISAINAIESGGGTVFAGAIQRAGETLNALKSVEKKHIILITDGDPGDSATDYQSQIERFYKSSGITTSIICIGNNNAHLQAMEEAAKLGGGNCFPVNGNTNSLATQLKEDLSMPAIKDINYGPFTPAIKDHTAAVSGLTQEMIPQLTGYYGTKIKEGAEVPLTAAYVPIYAQWKYGLGSVGSFMCDLNGTWSAEFLSNGNGVKFLHNVIGSLFPTDDIRPREIDAAFVEDNYTTQVSVYTVLEPDETVEIVVTPPVNAVNSQVQYIRPNTVDGYSRISFTVFQSGVYEVLVQKKNGEGDVVAEYLTYKAFSYSREYDRFVERDGYAFMQQLAQSGKGTAVVESLEVFDGFEKTVPQEFDPRLLFLILAVCLFLLEIAVRKFKFKWIHEWVRERREKKVRERTETTL